MIGAFINLPLWGHINPTLSVLSELKKFNHEIVYFLPATFGNVLKEYETTHISYECSLLEKDIGNIVSEGRLALESMRCWKAVILPILNHLETIKPNYIVCDSGCVWGSIIASALNLPLLTSHTMFVTNPRSFSLPPRNLVQTLYKNDHEILNLCTELYDLYDEVYRELNLGEFSYRYTQSYPGHMIIVFVPPWFQTNPQNTGDRFQFVGPSIPIRNSDNFPISQSDHKRLLYISLGTLFTTKVEVYKTCLEAFNDGEWQLVISAGASYDTLTNVKLPKDCYIFETVDQVAILERASAFISHGGMNGIIEALYCGVPTVLIPFIAEQKYNAKYLTELKLCTSLDHEQLTPVSLRSAVEMVATNMQFRQRLSEVKADIRNMNGANRAAELIHNLALQFKTSLTNLS